MTLDKETLKKLRWLIVFTILVFAAVWNLDIVISALQFLIGILAPFLLGAAIAFILSVPMARIEKTLLTLSKRNPSAAVREKHQSRLRPFSLLLTLLFVIALLALVILVIAPELGSTVAGLGRTIQDSMPKLLASAEERFRNNEEITYWLNNLNLNWENMLSQATNFFRSGADLILGSTFSVVKSIASGVANFVIGFVFACYILIQKETLCRQCRKLLYAYCKQEHAKRILDIAALAHRTFSNFLTGQCLEAVILGSMFFIAMSVLRFPYPLLVGVLIAVTALIPIFGAFIGCFVAAFLILMVSPIQALAFVVMFLILQQIEGNFIYPHVVGGSVGLPSIWVLVAVTVGGSLMGIVGMLIFIPLLSVLYALLRQDVSQKLKKKHLDFS